jgi:hypothetical protein
MVAVASAVLDDPDVRCSCDCGYVVVDDAANFVMPCPHCLPELHEQAVARSGSWAGPTRRCAVRACKAHGG